MLRRHAAPDEMNWGGLRDNQGRKHLVDAVQRLVKTWRFSVLKSVLISPALFSQYGKFKNTASQFSVSELTALQGVWLFCFWVETTRFSRNYLQSLLVSSQIMAVFPSLLLKLSVGHTKQMRSEVALNSYTIKCLLVLVDVSIDTLAKVLLA